MIIFVTPSIKPVAMYHGFVVRVSVVSSENLLCERYSVEFIQHTYCMSSSMLCYVAILHLIVIVL